MAYTTYTYNQIVKFFTDLTSAHKQIKGFGSGWIRDIEATLGRNTLYPYVWLEPVSESVAENVTTFSLRLYCLDLVKKDQSNEQEVISDTSQIMRDIILVLREEDLNIQVVGVPVLEPVSENFGDVVSGWTTLLEVEVNFANGYCGLPMDAFGGGGTTCEQVTIDDNGTIVYVDAGGSYVCSVGGGGVCADAIVQNNTGAYSTTVASGGTLILPTTPVTAEDSNLSPIGTFNVPSVSGGSISIPDVTADIYNSNAQLIGTAYIPAGGGTVSVGDTPLFNSEFTFIANAPSGANYTLADVQLDFYVNGVFNQTVSVPVYKTDTINVTL